jgi:hypothetical protein
VATAAKRIRGSSAQSVVNTAKGRIAENGKGTRVGGGSWDTAALNNGESASGRTTASLALSADCDEGH